MKQIHLILQGKGGVGKSFIASLLQQHFIGRKLKPLGIDTDPVNATFAGYKALKVERLKIMSGSNVDPSTFDVLMEQILEADENSVFVIDNGASTFLPLCGYLFENDVVNFLKDNGCEVFLHTVLTGGQALAETSEGIANLFNHFPKTPIVIWINEYFGKPEVDGKSFEQTNLYKKNTDHIRGMITIPELTKETFGKDMRDMMSAKMTFDETLKIANFSIMAKHRLVRVWKDLNGKISNLEFKGANQ